MLEVRDLRVRYGTVEALKGLSLQVPAGAIVGLIGPNGAGKTTSLRALTGLIRPSSGDARFENKIGRAPRRERVDRRVVGRTLQQTTLFQEMTALENVLLGLHLHSKKRLCQ